MRPPCANGCHWRSKAMPERNSPSAACTVVYGEPTDNARVAACGKLTSFHHCEGRCCMVPNRWFYQLVLVARILICLRLHVWWADTPPCVAKAPLNPDRPRSKRAKEPNPFTGYIHKPLCEACEASPNLRPPALGSPTADHNVRPRPQAHYGHLWALLS